MQNLQKKILKNWILLVIVGLGIFFRFYMLGSSPPGPSVDEVSTGYNAYSLFKTGRDEYGEKFPLILRSYDDFQPALYAYLVIPFVVLFGLTVEAVRLPSVILSVATLIATYFLVIELFQKNKNAKIIALLSVFFLSISPWHIYLSRLGFPANPGLSFLILGILFFLKKKYLLSLPLFSLSFISYHSEKVILPFIFLFLIVAFKGDVLKFKKHFLVGIVIAGLISIPFLKASFSPDALKRLDATSIKNSYDLKFLAEKEKYVVARQNNDLFGRIIHSEKVVTALIIADNYRKHFYPEWLFTNKSGIAMHKIPSFGLLHIFEAVLIVLGAFYLFRSKVSWKIKGLVSISIISAPFAAAITSEAPHAVRSYTFLPWLHILSALGATAILSSIQKKPLKKAFMIIGLGLIVILSVHLYRQYFFVFPKSQSSSFYLPLFNSTKYVLEEKNEYKKIVIDVKDNLYQSYMYYLYISKYNPKVYLSDGGTISGGYEQQHMIENIEFRAIGKDEVYADDILYIINKKDYVRGNVVEEFRDLQGTVLIQAVVK